MSRFRRVFFVAAGISLFTTLMVALTRSKKLRQELGKRFEVVRNARPSREQLKQFTRKVGTGVRKTRNVLSNLLPPPPEPPWRLMQRRQKGGSRAEPSAQLVEQHEQDSSKKPDNERVRPLVAPGAE